MLGEFWEARKAAAGPRGVGRMWERLEVVVFEGVVFRKGNWRVWRAEV